MRQASHAKHAIHAIGASAHGGPSPQASTREVTGQGTGSVTNARGLWFMILFRISKKALAGRAFVKRSASLSALATRGDDNLQVLHALAHEEMTSLYMFHPRVMFRVVGHGDRRLVVDMQVRGLVVAKAEVGEQRAK